jgi:hypothetical protein
LFVYYIQWHKKEENQREHGEANAKLVVIYGGHGQQEMNQMLHLQILHLQLHQAEEEEEPKRTKDAVTKNK